MKWNVVYKKAIDDNGELLFPERLTQEFLLGARKTMGSYMFANQYQNEIIPADKQNFKREWLKYTKEIPAKTNCFAFFDPAISQEDTADFTGVTVVKIDSDDNWYVVYAQRHKITPTQIIELLFRLHAQFKPNAIGIETVAYQQALLYMLDSEMRKRGVILPVTGVNHGSARAKEQRILGLVPRFEWGRMHLAQGLTHLEDELMKFPRGAHDDIVDSLSSIEQIAFKPEKESVKNDQPNPANAAAYEQWYRRELGRKASQKESSED